MIAALLTAAYLVMSGWVAVRIVQVERWLGWDGYACAVLVGLLWPAMLPSVLRWFRDQP